MIRLCNLVPYNVRRLVKDPDFELIFSKLSDEEIRATFTELFATLSI